MTIFVEEWDDELRLKRNQLDVLQAHNRLIQTRAEINRRRSSLGIETLRYTNTQSRDDNPSSSSPLHMINDSSNDSYKENEHCNEGIILECIRSSMLKTSS